MDPIVVTLRSSKTPAPSAAVGGEISGPEYDATITALKTAAEQLDAEKLAVSAAVVLGPANEVTATAGDKIPAVRAGTAVLLDAGDLGGSGGMANPMTTAGDAIVGGASGAPTRLPIGTNGHVLTAVAGAIAWAAPASTSPSAPITVTHNGAGGTPVTGDTLTANFATGWSGPIQWQRAGVDIGGATAATYTLVEADEGQAIRPVYTAHVFSAPAVTAGAPAATVPAAFTVGQWTAEPTATPGEISFNLTALPSDGGSAITALQYRVGAGAAIAFTGTATGVRVVTAGLTAGVAADLQVRAVNAVNANPDNWSDVKTRTPAAAGGSLPVVNQTAIKPGSYTETHVATFGTATTAGRTVTYQIGAGAGDGVPVVTGSDGVSFGAAAHSFVSDGNAVYFFVRVNCPALTAVTATFAGGVSAAGAAHEISNLGSAPVVDGTMVLASGGFNVNPWLFSVSPTVASTLFLGHGALTGARTVASALPAGAVAGTYDAVDAYSFYVYAALESAGAQDVSVTLNDTSQGPRAGIVLRAGA